MSDHNSRKRRIEMKLGEKTHVFYASLDDLYAWEERLKEKLSKSRRGLLGLTRRPQEQAEAEISKSG